jgi:biotin carboxyl carrier protein
MKYEVQLRGPGGTRARTVELERDGERWSIKLDGEPIEADAVELDAHTISVLLHGESHEIRIAPAAEGALKIQAGSQEFTAEVVDPRAWSGRRHGHVEAEGRQQIVAPMPGKVVRVLVKAGDAVESGQGLLVVEAMKMQNEIRSPKSGVVERVLATEGQPVNAGEVLCIIN